jgi:hypothetical protein
MNKFKLISFELRGTKWAFLIEFRHIRQEIHLKEKPDWPVLMNQDINFVEKWLFKNYRDLVKLAF